MPIVVTESLTRGQQALLESWLPGMTIIRNHSWGLVGTLVLEVMQDGQHYIVKAGDDEDRHIAGELQAHGKWLQPWTALGRAPVLVNGDAHAKIVVTRFLPGTLVQGTPEEWQPETFRQAGARLAELHNQSAVVDPGFEAAHKHIALGWLAGPHRISPALVDGLRSLIHSWPTPPAVLVPTHGDWQPRNWLHYEGELRIIDFGRTALRPAFTDFLRLDVQQFVKHRSLEEAFLEGYGSDPREPDAYRRNRVREAIGTAAWAFKVGDGEFEQQGFRMIDEALEQ